MCTLNLKQTGSAALVLAATLSAWPALSIAAAISDKKAGPAFVEPIDGGKLNRVVLTQKAAERLAIKTSKIVADASGNLAACRT